MARSRPQVSEMLVIVKSREIQRAMLADLAKNRAAAAPHFLAAAHLELVLADDYEQAGQATLAFRSKLSAASCFWRGGQEKQGRKLLESLIKDHPKKARVIREAISELERS